MFSRRTHWDQRPNPISRAWSERLVSGLPCFDLAETNPTRCGFRYPAEEILSALGGAGGLLYEPDPLGLPEAREAVAEAIRAGSAEGGFRDDCVAASLILTASTSEAYGWLFKLLCERGDEVLIPHPSYPLLEYLSALEEVALVSYPLHYDGRWRIDREALSAAVTSRTRAVVVIHPNNPTGNFVTAAEADWLRRFCAEKGLAVISDEVFWEYGLRGYGPASEGSRFAGSTNGRPPGPDVCSDDPDADAGSPDPDSPAASLALASPCLAFSLGGLSKSAALPQIKVGWIRCGGPEPLAREARARCEIIADTYLSVNTPAQRALPKLLATAPLVRSQVRERVGANLDFLKSLRGLRSTWEELRVEGGWSVVIRVPRVLSEERWCLELIQHDGVRLQPGYFFDFPSEAFLVASLLPERSVFREAMERFAAFSARVTG